ncbi:MAG: gamma-glutamyl-gamma-aminobutyrate hydrolase family protein, partial [Eubacteriales bacterium]|nr:gamma-glutamyl-gamma-aminobutyrate hydrolase family protein [Eubacteriales bacterium]
GICRGVQMLNVALGGTLIQDLPSQHRREEGLPAMSHRQTALGQYPSHRVEVAEGSLLEQIVGQREIWVNSFHHQAVGEVASCANLSAWAADGVVEAIELPDALFVLGVQWHPEIMTRLEEEASRRLFAAFAEAARG